MTPPSGQELEPGNRTQRPRRQGYEDGGMAERERERNTDDGKNKTQRKREKESRREKKTEAGTNKRRDLKGKVFVCNKAAGLQLLYVCECVTFIELGVLWESRSSKPITSLLCLNLCKVKIKQ